MARMPGAMYWSTVHFNPLRLTPMKGVRCGRPSDGMATVDFCRSDNIARIHQTLRITPAMAAGVSDHLWSIDEIIALLGDK